MKPAIATVCLSGVLNEKLEAIAAAGFKHVELFENDLLSFNGKPAEVRRMIEGLGLSIVTFQPFRDFEGMQGDRRERAFQRAERKLDVMAELGCELLMICSNVSPESLGGIDRAAADLNELGERAKARRLKVCFEALAWGRHINDYRDAWEAVRRADHANVGLVLDTFHILARKLDLRAIRSIPRDRIFLVQVADAPIGGAGEGPGVDLVADRLVPPGAGGRCGGDGVGGGGGVVGHRRSLAAGGRTTRRGTAPQDEVRKAPRVHERVQLSRSEVQGLC